MEDRDSPNKTMSGCRCPNGANFQHYTYIEAGLKIQNKTLSKAHLECQKKKNSPHYTKAWSEAELSKHFCLLYPLSPFSTIKYPDDQLKSIYRRIMHIISKL